MRCTYTQPPSTFTYTHIMLANLFSTNFVLVLSCFAPVCFFRPRCQWHSNHCTLNIRLFIILKQCSQFFFLFCAKTLKIMRKKCEKSTAYWERARKQLCARCGSCVEWKKTSSFNTQSSSSGAELLRGQVFLPYFFSAFCGFAVYIFHDEFTWANNLIKRKKKGQQTNYKKTRLFLCHTLHLRNLQRSPKGIKIFLNI